FLYCLSILARQLCFHFIIVLQSSSIYSLSLHDALPISYHHRGAQNVPEAFRFTLEAARRAETALAFERAAELYRTAIELRGRLPEGPGIAELYAAEGDALKTAGRGAAAAGLYPPAAAASPR